MTDDKMKAAALEDFDRAVPKCTYTHAPFIDAILPTTYETIRTCLQPDKTVEVLKGVRDGLDEIRKSGFVSYQGEKPHVIACNQLAALDALIERK